MRRRNELVWLLEWSVMQGSNLRPSGPKPDALPGCANYRLRHIIGIRLLCVNFFFMNFVLNLSLNSIK